MNSSDFTVGMLLGGFIAIIVFAMLSHKLESKCQFENNVADCKWVSVPVQIETKVAE